ncbi:uncharacterized protein LOC127842592 isoform X4 [Dreissena polymorpha]|uniref:uncharacterized protein LOC127842592 isoform X3 n=1 Tax=Dreissena polymorpha TaxID=45954 RepID=UPI00226456D8|nr:uncharacterized protein LOC127842592 isoform X3 [Dreissena polymorpha]XP_052228134.1 uncharacterized protein LOC127842592 isoform X4 [Dreissena polymorpha]
MDLQVLCVLVAVAYVDVSARITCYFQPTSWTSAMQHCLNIRGTPVSISSILFQTGLHLNGSFWTADYASRIATTEYPVECEYRTYNILIPISPPKFGSCEVIRDFICRDNNMITYIASCLKKATWKAASRCNKTSFAISPLMPFGDYWPRGAFRYQNYTFTDDSRKHLDRCGMVDGQNFTGNDLSVCGSDLPTTFVSHKIASLTETIMSISENTATENIVRNHDSTSSGTKVKHHTEPSTATMMSIKEDTSTEFVVRLPDSSSSSSALGIGFCVSTSIVVIVLITIVGVCIYKRRYRRKLDNSQVSVYMNALYDVNCRNETPRKPAHKNESY